MKLTTLLFATALSAAIPFSASADANSANGIWQTQASSTGSFLHVQMKACGDKTCGFIHNAFTKDGKVIPNYANKGKRIVWDMVSNGATAWGQGKIWAPDKNKTYNSKMSLVNGNLHVSGCVLFICRSQVWRKAG